MKRFGGLHLNKLLYNKINPILFDVSLRDGIQMANPANFNTDKKIQILKDIAEKYAPPKMEIGSFVSPKELPIMADINDVFHFAHRAIRENTLSTETYVLVPNKFGLMQAIMQGARNFSFITSVSNPFQIKNTKRDLDYKKKELTEMMTVVSNLPPPCKTKLYVSCISECPISGSINNDFIIYEILSSYGINDLPDVDAFDEICLSDTMGTLKHRDFQYIVEGLMRFGLHKSRISVHLHINSENEREAKNILFECFYRGINKFDVSVLSDGGCSITMKYAKPNMTYDFFYSTLTEYLEDVEHIYPFSGL